MKKNLFLFFLSLFGALHSPKLMKGYSPSIGYLTHLSSKANQVAQFSGFLMVMVTHLSKHQPQLKMDLIL